MLYIKYSLRLVLFFMMGISWSQVITSDKNYVHEVIPQQPVTIANFNNVGGLTAPLEDRHIQVVSYFDGLGRSEQRISIQGGGLPFTPNYVSGWTVNWTTGSGNMAFYNQIGQTSENQRLYGDDPFGKSSIVWQCGNDALSDADGGWDTDYISIDKSKSYRYTVWVKRSYSQDGTTYHGTQNVNNLDGSPNSNPYFWNGDLPVLGKWYLLVGLVHPYGYTGGDQGVSGVYDLQGNKVLDGTEFTWGSGTVNARFRNYLYYSTDTNTRQYFFDPVLEQVDGSELSLSELISGGDIPDIVSYSGYDQYGRQSREYLPYAIESHGGRFLEGDQEMAINSYYQATYPNDINTIYLNPFSEKEFEPSPLNKVTKQGAPGYDWRVGGGHEIKFEYQTNTYDSNNPTSTSNDNVRLLGVTTVFANDIYTPTLTGSNTSYYEPGELYKNTTKDENWISGKNHTTEEFTDKQGKVVLKRTYNGAAHDTYYVYDDFGNLTYVLPPLVNTVDGVSATELSELCYQYIYDYRNRLVEKKIPGKGWEHIVYNKLDQPILTQDEIQRNKPTPEWLFTKYDSFGRVAYTGLVTGGTRSSHQTAANGLTISWVDQATTTTVIGGTSVFYNNVGYPTNNISEVYTINYYDAYVDAPGLSVPSPVQTQPIATSTKGLATVSKIRVLTTNNWITTITGYDQKGRAIYTASDNTYLGTNDVVETLLDFTGKVKYSKSTHIKGASTPIVVEYYFNYDHMGRLLTQEQKINSGATEVIAENSYDALGQLKQKKVGGNLQTVDYSYNIRGWLKQINDPNSLGTDLFAFKINYNTPTHGATQLYNGNISETEWRTGNTDNSLRWYRYSYDALNRIIFGIDNTTDQRYSVSGIEYDKNGNIGKLKRNGHRSDNPLAVANTDFGLMDDLVYSYDSGNKLEKVDDRSPLDRFGFKDDINNAAADTTNDYWYDVNGNMLSDANKGITSILWNHINLPTEIKFNNSNTQKINYTYSADGIKVRKVVNDGGNVTTTDYAGSYQYVNNDLKFINNIEDGYVYPKSGGGYGYVYYYTDQLDNIRLSYTDADGNGSINPSTEIIKEANFYPFGLVHKGYNSVVNPIGSSFHKYDYQNQERQDELGLNWLQFKYRMYDPALGRFVSIDPLADSYVHNATYAFAENKVIKYNELEGLEITLNKFDKLSRDNRQGFEGHAVFLANAGLSVVNGAIDIFNYAGDLDRADQAEGGFGRGAGTKLVNDAINVKNSIVDYATNTSLSEFGSDVVNVVTDPNTSEDAIGGFVSGAAFSKISRFGSISKASSKSDNFVFRGDMRSPEEIFRDGFTSKGTNFDLQAHAGGLIDDSGYIATSKSFDVAKSFVAENGGFVYKIKTPSNAIDVNAKLGNKSPYPFELEKAVPLEIDARLIRSATRVTGSGLNINF